MKLFPSELPKHGKVLWWALQNCKQAKVEENKP
jgi:hypothetical protein